MALTQEQSDEIKKSLQGGANVGDIQKLLSEKFGINMTYMDVRFLLDDLNLELVDKPEPKKPEAEASASPAEVPASLKAPQAQLGGVQLELSPVMRPGMIAAGNVTFSDGVKASWEIDQDGRLRLDGAAPDYRPSDADLADFQTKLRSALGA